MSSETRLSVYKALHKLGQMQSVIQDTHGNVSARDDMGNIYIKPSGVPYKSITVGSVCKIDIDGNQLFGQKTGIDEIDMLKPSVDTIHHAAIYERRPNIKAICHTHSPYATAYAYNGKSIR